MYMIIASLIGFAFNDLWAEISTFDRLKIIFRSHQTYIKLIKFKKLTKKIVLQFKIL
jgi:hypothetical protein